MKRRVFLILLLAALLCGACSRDGGLYKSTREIMGTYVTITAVREGIPEVLVRAGVADGFKEIERVDRLMSTYKPESELSEINRQAGVRPVKADPEVVATIKDSLDVARMTDGAFDPTVGPLVRLWGIGGDKARVPSPDEIKKALILVDYRQVVVDEKAGTVFIKKKGMAIDLGGIAKGYASDLAVKAMEAKGVRGGIVAVAGDLKLFGAREGASLWRIGIQHPREEGALIAKLDATDIATSTSGDYERFFIKDGVRYHHITDPRTGYPAKGLISVTVLAKQSYLADSLATGLFVMGPDKAYAFAQAHTELEVLLVTSEGRILATGRFKGLDIAPVKVEQERPS